MRNITGKTSDYNTLPLWQAAREREYRALPYPAKRLMAMYGLELGEALRMAERIGWNLDQ